MSIALINFSEIPEIFMDFAVDTVAELALLPTTTSEGREGDKVFKPAPLLSRAYCIENNTLYILSSAGWVIRP